MNFTEDAFNLAKSRMLSNFNKALAKAEAQRNADIGASEALSTPPLPRGQTDVAAGATDVPATGFREPPPR